MNASQKAEMQAAFESRIQTLRERPDIYECLFHDLEDNSLHVYVHAQTTDLEIIMVAPRDFPFRPPRVWINPPVRDDIPGNDGIVSRIEASGSGYSRVMLKHEWGPAVSLGQIVMDIVTHFNN